MKKSSIKVQSLIKKEEILSLDEYLELARKDKSVYASPAERMLKAIGEPTVVDTAKDSRLSRIFGNRLIRKYKAFDDFYGLEDVIERLISYFRHSAQGLEESRQVLYLLGAPGTAKSSLAERLKKLMESEPVYVLAVMTDDGIVKSPINESPLGLFDVSQSEELGIPERYLKMIPSPWAIKRFDELGGELSQFKVVKLYPSALRQVVITKTEPGDENNQDISTLVGKLDIRKLEHYSQSDPDAYSFSGGLSLSNQGLLDFVEMFKAPIKVLNPLLTATQDKNYKGTEAIGAIPYDGIVLAHSNESEWLSFKTDKKNEAFLDRIYLIDVPYCLRATEEVKIYEKLLKNSSLADAPIAPGTLRMLAEFCVLSRLEVPENSNIVTKMRVYDGESGRERDPTAKSLSEYKDLAGHLEGFAGISTRFAYKILSEVFNFDMDEVAADPVHLLYVLEQSILREHFPEGQQESYLATIKGYLTAEYKKIIEKDVQSAYLDSYDEYGQSLFDRYIVHADHWLQDNDYRDPDTGQILDIDILNKELQKLEKPAEIPNVKDFRHEVVNFCLRHQAKHEGKNPDWKGYDKLRKVIERSMFSKTEDLLPVISFAGHGNKAEDKKHRAFIDRMKDKGYTEKQVQRAVEWFGRVGKQK